MAFIFGRFKGQSPPLRKGPGRENENSLVNELYALLSFRRTPGHLKNSKLFLLLPIVFIIDDLYFMIVHDSYIEYL